VEWDAPAPQAKGVAGAGIAQISDIIKDAPPLAIAVLRTEYSVLAPSHPRPAREPLKFLEFFQRCSCARNLSFLY